MYWRGRIWAPLNYWVYLGLQRTGETNAASDLAEKSLILFEKSWQQRLCGENYNADTGEVLDQADTDAFYSWGALLPLIKLSTVINVTPWSGLTVCTEQISGSIGPVHSPVGLLEMHKRDDCWEMVRNGELWLRGTVSGTLSQLQCDGASIAMILTNTTDAAWIERPLAPLQRATLSGVSIEPQDGKIQLPACCDPCVFESH